MEIKMINLKRAEFKDTLKIKVKKIIMRQRMVSWDISSQIWTRPSVRS